jgi:tRNA A-37 threonylcarbamoyl transferase component Bud32
VVSKFKIFETSGKSIFKKRNEIKVIDGEAYKLFKVPHLLNRVVYTFLRKSKAERSFINGVELRKLGVETPEPKSFHIEKRGGLLYRSIYISSYIEGSFEIRDVFNLKVSNREELLREFGQFIYKLHSRGVLHTDFSPGNTIIERVNNNYRFYLVDINRLKFKKLNFRGRAENFSKLSTSDLDLRVIAEEYCKLSKDNREQFLEAVFRGRRAEERFLRRKRFFKRVIGKC